MTLKEVIRPGISWGNIISTLVVIVTMGVGWGVLTADVENHVSEKSHPDTELRLDNIEKEQIATAAAVSAAEKHFEDLNLMIISRMDRFDKKLDRIEDRVNENGAPK